MHYTLLTSIALQILRTVSICCGWFLFGVCYYVKVQFTPRGVINDSHYSEQNLSTNNINLLQFKIQGQFQKKGTLNAGASEVFRRK